jgi:hypothetical protein
MDELKKKEKDNPFLYLHNSHFKPASFAILSTRTRGVRPMFSKMLLEILGAGTSL